MLDSLIPTDIRLDREKCETNSLIWSHGVVRVDVEYVYFLFAKIKYVKGLLAQMHSGRRKNSRTVAWVGSLWKKVFLLM